MPHDASQTSLIDHFSALADPRQSWKVLYPLDEILLVYVCATTGGADGFVEMSDWGKANLDFLRRFLPFEAGIPSHDTLNDVAASLDWELFEDCFAAWTETLRTGDSSLVPVARADGGDAPDPRTGSPVRPHRVRRRSPLRADRENRVRPLPIAAPAAPRFRKPDPPRRTPT